MGWNPGQYLKFGAERLRPANDLLARAAAALAERIPGIVVDLGCGTGAATGLLCACWPTATVVGIDGSPRMLAEARASRIPARWVEADLATWRTEVPVDLLFSNAALHWLEDHASLLPRLMTGLAPGGVLAVQMPRNHKEPSHRLMLEAAAAGPWRDRLAAVKGIAPVLPAASYHDLLSPFVTALDVWETVYLHALEGENPVAQWTRGTGLRPYLDALEEAERTAFFNDYAARVARAYPRRADGRTLFPFRRVFIVATRAP